MIIRLSFFFIFSLLHTGRTPLAQSWPLDLFNFSLWSSALWNTVEMKGLVDKPNHIIELQEGGVTLEDVIDGHICEQTLVSSDEFPWNVSNIFLECILLLTVTPELRCLNARFHLLFLLKVDKSAFVVGNLGALMRQHTCWQSIVPQLQPYFPVKCNSSPAVIEVLASLGLGFVCANKVSFLIQQRWVQAAFIYAFMYTA